MIRYKWTTFGLFAAVALWAIDTGFNLDLFESVVACMKQCERLEPDALIFPAAIIYIFLMIDLNRRQQISRIGIEKLKVYQSMITAMNHILNNFLQKMLLFKMAAEETQGFDPEALKRYDTIIDEARAQIDALECIAKPDEENILKTIGHPL